jgi:hypothetical protein
MRASGWRGNGDPQVSQREAGSQVAGSERGMEEHGREVPIPRSATPVRMGLRILKPLPK